MVTTSSPQGGKDASVGSRKARLSAMAQSATNVGVANAGTA
jgi:hypothetical protein